MELFLAGVFLATLTAVQVFEYLHGRHRRLS